MCTKYVLNECNWRDLFLIIYLSTRIENMKKPHLIYWFIFYICMTDFFICPSVNNQVTKRNLTHLCLFESTTKRKCFHDAFVRLRYSYFWCWRSSSSVCFVDVSQTFAASVFGAESQTCSSFTVLYYVAVGQYVRFYFCVFRWNRLIS
jgi:hypothetical protein